MGVEGWGTAGTASGSGGAAAAVAWWGEGCGDPGAGVELTCPLLLSTETVDSSTAASSAGLPCLSRCCLALWAAARTRSRSRCAGPLCLGCLSSWKPCGGRSGTKWMSAGEPSWLEKWMDYCLSLHSNWKLAWHPEPHSLTNSFKVARTKASSEGFPKCWVDILASEITVTFLNVGE